MKRTVIALFAALLVVACSTTPDGSRPESEPRQLFGMVYDGSNRAVSGAQIQLERRLEAATDENEPVVVYSDFDGRFILPSLVFGTYQLAVSKPGYETLRAELEFLNDTQTLHLRMTAMDELIDLAQDALRRRRWSDAEAFLSRAADIDRENPVQRYLRAILYDEQGFPERAVDALNDLASDGYDEVHVHLYLADLYEYRLDDLDMASEHLLLVRERMGDEEIDRRLSAIERKKEQTVAE